jgi:hypothetical protein
MTPEHPAGDGHRALIEVTPELLDKLRQPKIVLAIALAVAGAIAEFVGYWGVSGTLDPGKQLPYLISGGIGGIFLLGASAILFLSADLGSVRQEVRDGRAELGDVRALVESVAQDVQHLRASLDGGTRASATTRSRARK